MSWRTDLDSLWEENPTFRRVVYFCIPLGLAYVCWNGYKHEIKNVAIGVLIVAAGLIEETTWYFWVILVAAYLWINNGWKNRRRHDEIIRLLSEIRDRLNPR